MMAGKARLTKRLALVCGIPCMSLPVPAFAQQYTVNNVRIPAAQANSPQRSVEPRELRFASVAQQDSFEAAPPGASPVASSPSVSGLEEIVVTATRREERLQEIPVAVTALTSEGLEAAGIAEIDELTLAVPGLLAIRNYGGFQPVIRGVGSTGISVGDESNVATYVDGIYQGGTPFTFIDLVEVERVEVLRGPQGTVFGRNATGGLINIITPDPGFKPRGRIAGKVARMRNDANEFDVRAYGTTGLTEQIAVDFAGAYRENDGYIKNLVGSDDYGDQQMMSLRSKLLFLPSDSAEFVLTGEYIDLESQSNAVQPYKNNALARNIPGVVLPADAWQASLTTEPIVNYERINLVLQTSFEFSAFNLETSSAYSKTDVLQSTDSDATNIFLGLNSFPADAETYSQEVRLLSPSDKRLNWLLGAYAFHMTGSMDISLDSSAGPGTTIRSIVLGPEVKTTSYAGFAEGTYELVDRRLFLTLGARYTTEKRKFEQFLNEVQLPFGTADNSENQVTYRAAVRYNFAEDANIYASHGTGFKSGVFNAIGTSPFATDPETITATEVGIKADPLPWLRANLSAYHYKYEDLQVVARDVTGLSYVLQNAADAEVDGAELEVTAAAGQDLNLRGAVAYMDAKYVQFPGAQTFVPLPNGGNQVVASDVSGNRMTRAPEWTLNLGFDWGRELSGGRLKISGNLYRSSRVYHDFLNINYQKAYTLANAELTWTTPNGRWQLGLWSTNMTNEKVFQQIRAGTLGSDVVYDQPRRVGLSAEFRY